MRGDYDNFQFPDAPALEIKVSPPKGRDIERVKCILASATKQTIIPLKAIKELGLKENTTEIPVTVQGRTEKMKGYLVSISLGPNHLYETIVTTTTQEYGLIGRDILNKLVLILDGREFRIFRH